MDTYLGIDEVGRGAWAGPLLFCGYLFSVDQMQIPGITDSKLINKKKRESFYLELKNSDHFIVSIDSHKIDTQGLSKSMDDALFEIIEHYRSEFIDLNVVIDGYFKKFIGMPNILMEPKADQNYYAVSCASIIAKVTRDKIMSDYSEEYPGYGFESHVGYGTKLHSLAIEKFGVTNIHRKSYSPIKRLLNRQ